MNIFVGNLNYQVTDNELQAMFEAFGQVSSTKIMRDPRTNRPRGFAHVAMNDNTQAANAIAKLHNKNVYEQTLIVNELKARGTNEFKSSR